VNGSSEGPTRERRKQINARAASDSLLTCPSLVLSKILSTTESKITVDLKSDGISNYKITIVYGKLQANYKGIDIPLGEDPY
jgi:hypothetical protein